MSINEVMDTMISDGIEWRKRIHVAELTNLVEEFFFFWVECCLCCLSVIFLILKLSVVELCRNSKGYEIAKRFNSKFTHLSPVWYDLKR